MASLEGGKLLYPPLPPLNAWEMPPLPLLLPVSLGALALLVQSDTTAVGYCRALVYSPSQKYYGAFLSLEMLSL